MQIVAHLNILMWSVLVVLEGLQGYLSSSSDNLLTQLKLFIVDAVYAPGVAFGTDKASSSAQRKCSLEPR